jgi:flagellar protein FlgJ
MTSVGTQYTGWTAGDAISATASDSDKLKGVAKQFEAIFVRQMLSAARKTDFGGDALFGNGAIDTFREMQDSQVADIVSNTGTLGLAKQIEAHLAKFAGSSASAKAGVDGASAIADRDSPATTETAARSPVLGN